jgi:hypothetical protein
MGKNPTIVLNEEEITLLKTSKTQSEFLKNYVQKFGFDIRTISALQHYWVLRVRYIQRFEESLKPRFKVGQTTQKINVKNAMPISEDLLVSILNELRVLNSCCLQIEQQTRRYADAGEKVAELRREELLRQREQVRGP